ncbi:MAG TPA: flagellin [Bryobacteraceae bacterium]|nr:flagellin [Bryobacteraceae bacterium]
MSFSIQTNVNSLIAQENLRVNSDFQSQTIQRLTSGYRINSSGDDAAGLAIANGFRSDVAELTQGVRNANDGISSLQIIDGGMNNISNMLDRLRTLATQSASDTFTGDRSVLNQEFQSLLTEIDRQSQSIGLDQNGTFAKSLSVFIGGGRAHGSSAVSTSNGTIGIDLRSSAVDTASLGLKGMQVVAGTEDIGTGSPDHTVSQILSDSSNTTATAGFTDLYFSGPGFSDGSKVKVSVNLQGVTDVDGLAAAINNAITSAGNGSTQAATEFKNAGIVASVHTDANGGKELAFSSSTTAFQVQAGDQMANALMGNFSSGATGVAVASTLSGANTAASATAFTPTNVTVRISGSGLSSPVDITLDAASTTVGAAITDLTNKINGNSALQAAGISVSGSASSPLVFTSALGETFSVQSTGDTANALGLGTFVAGSGGAADYTTITGAAYAPTTSGAATLEFSLNGAASGTAGTGATVVGTDIGGTSNTAGFANPLQLMIDGTAVNVDFSSDPNAGATETTANIVNYINSTVRQALGLGSSVKVASATGNTITLTSPTANADSSIEVVANATSAALKLTADATTNASGTGTGAVGNAVTVNLAGGTATAANVLGSALGATVDTTAATLTGGTTVNFTVDGVAIAADLATDPNKSATESVADIANFLNTAAQQALGTSATVVSINAGRIQITSPTTGGSSTVTVTDGGAASASRALGLTSTADVTGTGTAPTGTDIANRLNQAFNANSTLQKAGLTASFSGGDLTIQSSNGTYFRLNAHGVTGADLGFGVTGSAFSSNLAQTSASSSSVDANGTSNTTAVSFSSLSYGNDDQAITISANDANGTLQSKTITLQNDSVNRNARTIDETVSYINQQLQQSNNSTLQKIVAVKEDDGGTEKINFISSLGSFNVSVGNSVNGNGVNAGAANTFASSTLGSASNVSIDSQATAEQAVAALATAVSTLGSAQAAVGKGQNQLNYAIGLAESQVTNFSAAESRIRDADVAAEAANLSKAQVLQQASIAAMAQANSAPQAILSLLRG